MTLEAVTRRPLHGLKQPLLGDLSTAGDGIHTTAEAFVAALTGKAENEVTILTSDYGEVASSLQERSATRRLPVPVRFVLREESSRAIYYIVRLLRPKLVMETGVANGHGSVLILNALRQNEGGRLISVDVYPHAGALVDPDEAERWDLRLMDGVRLDKQFQKIVAGVPTVDVFLHDSDHEYVWMKREFEWAREGVRPGGVILSDDVNHNLAFLELCEGIGRRPEFLWDGRRIFGGVRV